MNFLDGPFGLWVADVFQQPSPTQHHDAVREILGENMDFCFRFTLT